MTTTPPVPQPDQPIAGHTVFAVLRDALAELYPNEQDARIVVDDAGLAAKQIAFSSRAQTNWHNILAEAIRQHRLDQLLEVARTNYLHNYLLNDACDIYDRLRLQGGELELPVYLSSGDRGFEVTFPLGGVPKYSDRIATFWHQHRWWLWLLALLEIVFYTLYRQYRDQWLIAETAYCSVALLAAVALSCWGAFRRVCGLRLPKIALFLVATVSTFFLLLLLGQQIWAVVFPVPLAADHYGIVVATFGEGSDYRVTPYSRQLTELLFDKLKETVDKTYQMTNTVAIGRVGVVRTLEEGQRNGRRLQADLVIWGQVLTTRNGTVVHFQILQTPGRLDNPAFPEILPLSPGEVTSSVDISSTNSFYIREFAKEQGLAIADVSLGLYHLSTPNYAQAAVQFKRAEQQLKKVEAPNTATDLGLVLFYLARSYLELARYDDAMNALQQALTYRPDDPALYLTLAYIHRVRQERKEQKADLEKVLSLTEAHLTPEYEIPDLHNRGVALEALGRPEAALNEFMTLVEHHSDFFSGYLSEGRVLVSLKRYAEATDVYTQAATLAKDNPDRLLWLRLDQGKFYMAQGQLAPAIQAFQEASQSNPAQALPLYYLAKAYEEQGTTDEALLTYQKLVKVSDSGWAFSVYGKFLLSIGDYTNASNVFEKALGHYLYTDDKALVDAYAAQAYGENNDFKHASEHFKAALVAPGAYAAYIHGLYASVLAKFDHREEAIQEYETTLALDTTVAYEVRMNLALLYVATGRITKAHAVYEYLVAHQVDLTPTQQQLVRERLQRLLPALNPIKSATPEASR